jgi:hypothetical protein
MNAAFFLLPAPNYRAFCSPILIDSEDIIKALVTMNPNPERAHPIAIFTAVLFHPSSVSTATEEQRKSNSNCVGIDDCQDTVTSSLFNDDDCDRQDDTLDSDHDPAIMAAAQRLTCFQRYTMALGLIVGFFSDFSSLAATFLLKTVVGSTTTANSNIFWFSLGWYFFASVLGVTIFLLLRCIVTTAWNMTSSIAGRGNVVNDSAMIHRMGFHFTVGALVGVSLAMACTDFVLGSKGQSCVRLAANLIWCRAISYIGSLRSTLPVPLNATTTTSEGLAAPLISAGTGPKPRTDFMSFTTIMSYKRIFQRYSLALGTVVGFVIHFSQLGAKFFVPFTGIVRVSFGWSFLTLCMCVLILILLRNLVNLVWYNLDQEQEQDQDQHEDQQCYTSGVNTTVPALLNHLRRCIELCFAAGLIFGVNMGWVVTVTLLGLQPHWMNSILGLGFAVVGWCTSVAVEAQLYKRATEKDASSLLIV